MTPEAFEQLPISLLEDQYLQLSKWVDKVEAKGHQIQNPDVITRPYLARVLPNGMEVHSALPDALRYWVGEANSWMVAALKSDRNLLRHIANGSETLRKENFPNVETISYEPARLLEAMVDEEEFNPERVKRMLIGLKSAWILGGEYGYESILGDLGDIDLARPKDTVRGLSGNSFKGTFEDRNGNKILSHCPFELYSHVLFGQLVDVYYAADEDEFFDLDRSYIESYITRYFIEKLDELLVLNGLEKIAK